jgi:hypothetical protein
MSYKGSLSCLYTTAPRAPRSEDAEESSVAEVRGSMPRPSSCMEIRGGHVTGPTLARRLLIGCLCLDLLVGPPLLPPVSSFLHRLATPSSQVRNIIIELTLATFNSKQDIVLEYNSLGYAVGGVLS